MTGSEIILDFRGQRCPAPIIALGRQAKATPGVEVELRADDPAAAYDVPAWCRLRGATLLGVTTGVTESPQLGAHSAAELDANARPHSATQGPWMRFQVLLPTSVPGTSTSGG